MNMYTYTSESKIAKILLMPPDRAVAVLYVTIALETPTHQRTNFYSTSFLQSGFDTTDPHRELWLGAEALLSAGLCHDNMLQP